MKIFSSSLFQWKASYELDKILCVCMGMFVYLGYTHIYLRNKETYTQNI